mgnify:CR=1 FL=1
MTGLTLILQTRALDRIHYALMLAATSAALGASTTLFFAIEGVAALIPDALTGKAPQILATAAGESGEAFLGRLETAGAAAPEELIAALAELEARFAVCDTGLAVAGLTLAELRQDIPLDLTGLTEILAAGKDMRLVYV